MSITCPRCERTSYNLCDIRERYCGYCHVFLDDLGSIGPGVTPS